MSKIISTVFNPITKTIDHYFRGNQRPQQTPVYYFASGASHWAFSTGPTYNWHYVIVRFGAFVNLSLSPGYAATGGTTTVLSSDAFVPEWATPPNANLQTWPMFIVDGGVVRSEMGVLRMSLDLPRARFDLYRDYNDTSWSDTSGTAQNGFVTGDTNVSSGYVNISWIIE